MSDSPHSPPETPPLSRAVLKGCLLGAVLAASWAVFGAAIYAALSTLGVSLGLRVLISGLGGPAIGSALVVAWWLWKHPASRTPTGRAPAPPTEPPPDAAAG